MNDQPSENAIQEVIVLIEKLVNPVNLSENERDELLEELIQLVPHPKASDFIFWPERDFTPREMAIEMLTYQSTSLGCSQS